MVLFKEYCLLYLLKQHCIHHTLQLFHSKLPHNLPFAKYLVLPLTDIELLQQLVYLPSQLPTYTEQLPIGNVWFIATIQALVPHHPIIKISQFKQQEGIINACFYTASKNFYICRIQILIIAYRWTNSVLCGYCICTTYLNWTCWCLPSPFFWNIRILLHCY